MPGRMSINWLLNEDEESGLSYSDNSPPQHQEIRQSQDQEHRATYGAPRPMPQTTNSLLFRAGQSQHGSAFPSLPLRQHCSSSMPGRAGSISRSTQPRAPRPKYSTEEDHFIWYQRIDLEKDWKEVSHAFNEYFLDRHRDGESGLQCRFYRILDAAGIPNIRTLKNSNDKERIAQFGLVKQTGYRYPWMLPRHRAA